MINEPKFNGLKLINYLAAYFYGILKVKGKGVSHAKKNFCPDPRLGHPRFGLVVEQADADFPQTLFEIC